MVGDSAGPADGAGGPEEVGKLIEAAGKLAFAIEYRATPLTMAERDAIPALLRDSNRALARLAREKETLEKMLEIARVGSQELALRSAEMHADLAAARERIADDLHFIASRISSLSHERDELLRRPVHIPEGSIDFPAWVTQLQADLATARERIAYYDEVVCVGRLVLQSGDDVAPVDVEKVGAVIAERNALRARLDSARTILEEADAWIDHASSCKSLWARPVEMIEKDERWACDCGLVEFLPRIDSWLASGGKTTGGLSDSGQMG